MNAQAPTMIMPSSPPSRSALPSVLGWIAIVCGVLGVLAGATRAAMFSGLSAPEVAGLDPVLQEAALDVFGTASIIQALISCAIGYVGYALWKRRNWARRTFIVLLALSIVANTAWALFALAFGRMFAQLGAFFGGAMVFAGVCALAFAALFFWCIRRLRSPAVKSEFV